MIIHDVQQGTEAWRTLRLGIPTSSCFDQIITPKTMKRSASADKYLARLIAEWSTGEAMDGGSSEFMERGKQLEADALNWLEWEHGLTIRKVGFITNDAGTIGCSPDCLIEPDAGCEVKCLSAENHAAALLKTNPLDYRCQIQGCLLITGRAYWNRLYYNPTLPPLVLRIERDEPFIKLLGEALDEFVAKLEAAKARIINMGFDASQCLCSCGSRVDLQQSDYGVKCGACRAKLEEAEKAMFG